MRGGISCAKVGQRSEAIVEVAAAGRSAVDIVDASVHRDVAAGGAVADAEATVTVA